MKPPFNTLAAIQASCVSPGVCAYGHRCVVSMGEKTRDLVTGAFSYTGGFIANELLARGRAVRTMTNHPQREHPLKRRMDIVPYSFDDPEGLRRSLEGVHTFYNTYWIRFERDGLTFKKAVENTRMLLEACEEADVRRFVHVSVSNPEKGEGLPYYEGKLETERLVRSSGLSWRIIRPTLILGKGDILVNNIAWLLRKFPLFLVPGDGQYRLQPVSGEDTARIAVDAGEDQEEGVLDAAGPDTLTFSNMVNAIAEVVPQSGRVMHAPSGLALALCRMAGLLVHDVILTPQELEGLQRELLVSSSKPLGETGFSEWISSNNGLLGRQYASELDRHFR